MVLGPLRAGVVAGWPWFGPGSRCGGPGRLKRSEVGVGEGNIGSGTVAGFLTGLTCRNPQGDFNHPQGPGVAQLAKGCPSAWSPTVPRGGP
jgi:hypothetical protein